VLLRRVIEHVKAQNWTAVALDFVIVVVGVFIGIQVSNWNDARGRAETERALLTELRAALADDARAVGATLAHYREVDERAGPLLAHMKERLPYDPRLDQDFGVLYGYGALDLNRAVYESLKSQGLDLVSDPALRSQIVQVYERSLAGVNAADESELRVILDLLQPYFLKLFKDHRFARSATPTDYPALIDDEEFLNIVDYRLQIVRQNNIPRAESALADIDRLIAAIDKELNGS